MRDGFLGAVRSAQARTADLHALLCTNGEIGVEKKELNTAKGYHFVWLSQQSSKRTPELPELAAAQPRQDRVKTKAMRRANPSLRISFFQVWPQQYVFLGTEKDCQAQLNTSVQP
jgi:hypothetical protein